MNFDIDRQTLSDLGLFGNRKDEISIFSFYNRALTKGGQEMLHRLMRIPVADIEALESRKAEINFFFTNDFGITNRDDYNLRGIGFADLRFHLANEKQNYKQMKY